MATSSITKQFVVRDMAAFERLLAEAEESSVRRVPVGSDSLDRGREALARFRVQSEKGD